MKAQLNALYAAEKERLEELSQLGNGDYRNPVFGEGPVNAKVMFVGEAPGREEAEAGHPFVGKAGRQLNELLELAGIDRSEVYVTNAVKFRPTKPSARGASNRTPTAAELAAGEKLLKSEILAVCPRIIATLGNSPLTSISRISCADVPKIGAAHGKTIEIEIGENRIKLFPLYHPASGIYNRELVATMKEDIVALGRLIKEGIE